MTEAEKMTLGQLLWSSFYDSKRHIGIAIIVLGAATASLFAPFKSAVAGGSVLLADGYLLWLIFTAALRSEAAGRKEPDLASSMADRLPYRTAALAVVLALFVSFVLAFATLFICSGDIQSTAGDQYLVLNSDGIYFSIVTMTTLGYGDFVPKGSCGRWLVVGELGSAVLLVFNAVPIVLSRIANFHD